MSSTSGLPVLGITPRPFCPYLEFKLEPLSCFEGRCQCLMTIFRSSSDTEFNTCLQGTQAFSSVSA